MARHSDEDGATHQFGYEWCERATEKALLIHFDNGETLWVPRSVMPYSQPDVGTRDGYVRIEVWWARKNDLL